MTSQTSELVELIRSRCNQDFDGECHLTTTEARTIATLLERLSSSEVTEEEVERVARALCEANFRAKGCEGEFGNVDDCWFAFTDQARAAITAMRSAATSERKG